MEENNAHIFECVMRDMSEGVMVINLKGIIIEMNAAAEKILEMESGELIGRSFIQCFFEYAENDGFNQLILDSVYDPSATHKGIVEYYTGEKIKQLRVTTSYLGGEADRQDLIAVLSDISELSELRDAVKAMEQIRSLNEKLKVRNKLLNDTFGRFLSDEIVSKLMDSPDGLALGGRKQHLSILMSDLRGFTALSDTMEPQAMLDMLNHYLGEMTDVIQSFGGTIIEFIGDGIMAIFGAPTHYDDHAQRAVSAAITMQQRMADISDWNFQRGYPALEMGIGINTGDVIVGNIGSEKRTKYGVAGSPVNFCGRIESYTIGGQVLISDPTLEEIKVPVEYKNSFEVKPKGSDHIISIYNVVCIGNDHTLCLTDESAPPVELKKKVFLPFYDIRDKHTARVPFGGELTAISRDNARITTLAELHPYDNIELDIGEPLFAKVLSIEEHVVSVRITARPPCFTEFLREHTGVTP